MLARLGLAWLGMMQVMMFAFPGYLRDTPMTAEDQTFLDQAIIVLNWISLVLTVPVVLYCAWPVWKGAMGRLRRVAIGMDIPVALGILAAFIPSVHATWVGHGEVYFDSVTMFVAFLLTARYFEFCAQQSTGQVSPPAEIDALRAQLSQRANNTALWFTLAQLSLAVVVGVVWSIQAPQHAVAVTVALLVISCPCALAMSVPTAVAAAQAVLHGHSSPSNAFIAELAAETIRVSRCNLYGAMAWHLLLIPLAALGFVQPWFAAVTMLVSSSAVTFNSWLLYRRYRYAGPSMVQQATG